MVSKAPLSVVAFNDHSGSAQAGFKLRQGSLVRAVCCFFHATSRCTCLSACSTIADITAASPIITTLNDNLPFVGRGLCVNPVGDNLLLVRLPACLCRLPSSVVVWWSQSGREGGPHTMQHLSKTTGALLGTITMPNGGAGGKTCAFDSQGLAARVVNGGVRLSMPNPELFVLTPWSFVELRDVQDQHHQHGRLVHCAAVMVVCGVHYLASKCRRQSEACHVQGWRQRAARCSKSSISCLQMYALTYSGRVYEFDPIPSLAVATVVAGDGTQTIAAGSPGLATPLVRRPSAPILLVAVCRQSWHF